MLGFDPSIHGAAEQDAPSSRSLALKPKIMLFDEVTAALDPEFVGEVLRVVRELAHASDMSMLIVTHEMAFVATSALLCALRGYLFLRNHRQISQLSCAAVARRRLRQNPYPLESPGKSVLRRGRENAPRKMPARQISRPRSAACAGVLRFARDSRVIVNQHSERARASAYRHFAYRHTI